MSVSAQPLGKSTRPSSNSVLPFVVLVLVVAVAFINACSPSRPPVSSPTPPAVASSDEVATAIAHGVQATLAARPTAPALVNTGVTPVTAAGAVLQGEVSTPTPFRFITPTPFHAVTAATPTPFKFINPDVAATNIAPRSSDSGILMVKLPDPCEASVDIYKGDTDVLSSQKSNYKIQISPGSYDIHLETLETKALGAAPYVEKNVNIKIGEQTTVDLTPHFGGLTVRGCPDVSEPLRYLLTNSKNDWVNFMDPAVSGTGYCLSPGSYGIHFDVIPHGGEKEYPPDVSVDIAAGSIVRLTPDDWAAKGGFGFLSLPNVPSSNASFDLLDGTTAQRLGGYMLYGFRQTWVRAGKYKILLSDAGSLSGLTLDANIEVGKEVLLQIPR